MILLTPISRLNLNEIGQYLKEAGMERPQLAFAALDLAFRHVFAMDPAKIPFRNSIYYYEERLTRMLSPGLETWPGFSESVYPCQSGLYLNVNSSFRPFIGEMNMVDFMIEVVRAVTRKRVPANQLSSVMTSNLYNQVARALGSLSVRLDRLRVKTVHNPDRPAYPKLGGFTEGNAANTKFVDNEGRETNVVDHMKRMYGFDVKYPELRLLWTKIRNKRSKVEYPPECLMIKARRYNRELTGRSSVQLIRSATLNPAEKKRFIEQTLKAQLDNRKNAQHLRSWGISAKNEMLKVPTRVLPSPEIECGLDEVIDLQGKGVWNLKEIHFHIPIDVKSWAVVNYEAVPQPQIKALLNELIEIMISKGMEVDDLPFQVNGQIGDLSKCEETLKKAADGAKEKFGKDCQIILVILPTIIGRFVTTTKLYEAVKVASDQLVGIPSQCFLSRNFGLEKPDRRGGRQRSRSDALLNLSLKINAKMGGVHSVLHDFPDSPSSVTYPVLGDKPFMVMGADSTHPAPGSKDQRSVIGVSGSLDRSLTSYSAKGIVQKIGELGREIIVDLKSPVKELLMEYIQHHNGVKPESIIFYRDGVSQGEFSRVVEIEAKAIKEACAEISADYQPPLTFITIQKGHNIRILSADSDDPRKSRNCPPGTIVDTHICDPHIFDFYLISHAGLQGTNCPALYSVLVDENGFDADSLQLLTYHLCHVLCRCARSVSYSPPAFYAHLAAARFKILYLSGKKNVDPVNEKIKDTLFYC